MTATLTLNAMLTTSGVTVVAAMPAPEAPNDQGIGWNILASLQRVGLGFGLAALVGIPAGFMIGRFEYLNRMTSPLISLLRPVSSLASLPIGLMVFKAANPAAIWVIFIYSIWPMIINTATGVQRIPQDYLNDARVLNLSEWKVFTKILFPAILPRIWVATLNRHHRNRAPKPAVFRETQLALRIHHLPARNRVAG